MKDGKARLFFRRRTLIFIYCVTLILFLWISLFRTDAVRIAGGWYEDKTIDYSEGWHYNDGSAVDLNHIHMDSDGKARIYNTIPANLFRDDNLHFNSHNVFFKVFIEEKEVYSFETRWNITGAGYGDQFHTIELSGHDSGKSVMCIEITPIYPRDHSASLEEMMICSWQSYLHKEFYSHGFAFLLSLLVCFFGLTIIVFHFSSMLRHRNESDLLALGIVVICMGLWTAGETLIPNLMFGTTEMMRVLDFGFLMMGAFPMVVFVNSITKQRRARYVVAEFLVWEITIVIVLTARLGFGVDMHLMTPVIHLSIVIASVIMLIILIDNYRYCKKRMIKTDIGLFYIGGGIMILGALVDMVVYNIGGKANCDSGFYMRIGLTMFVIVMLYQISVWISREQKQTAKDRFITDLLLYSMVAASPDRNVGNMLEYMGMELSADRTFIVEEEADGSFTTTYEWAREGIPPIKDKLIKIPFRGGLDNWFTKFNRNEPVIITDLDREKDEYTAFYDNFKVNGVHSVVAYNLAIDETHIGCMGVVNPPKDQIPDIVDLMKLISFFLAVTLRQRNTHTLLKQYSYKDQMTGVMNRRALEEFEEDGLDKSRPYGVLMADINGLKRANDLKGHDAGDQMIRDVAAALGEVFGRDKVYRMGGDEFLAIGFSTTESGFVQKVKTVKLLIDAKQRSASMGYVYMPEGGEDFEAVKKQADTLMYKDKQHFYEEISHDRRTGTVERNKKG